MAFLDTVLNNLQKGYDRIQQGAALFSERIKFELNLMRLRARIANIRERITELHAQIGRRAVHLYDQDAHPKTFASFMKDEAVTAALAEASRLSKEIEDLASELVRDQEELAALTKQAGEHDE